MQVDDDHSIPLKVMSARQADTVGGDNVEGVDVVKELMRIEKKLEHIESLLNELLEGEESYAMMKLSEESLKEFLKDEPDIYQEFQFKISGA